MRTNQRCLFPWISWTFTMCALLGCTPAACLGQHTDVRDAGGGRKIELVYDAAEHVVETRTLDQAGKILVRVESDFRPGFLVAQHKTTSYWADGKSVRSLAEVSFDENGNFTGEAKQEFDASGQQSGGTKLTHDPWTGIYRCFEWKTATQQYQSAECPATEGSVETSEKPAELTYEDVMKRIVEARQTQRNEEKARRVGRKSLTYAPVTIVRTEVGLILPAQLRPGERVSGSVTLNPQDYEGVQDLRVIRMTLPIQFQNKVANLRGLMFEAAGESAQRSDDPITLTVPRGVSEFDLALRPEGDPAQAISRPVSIAAGLSHPNLQPARAFEAAAVCLKSDVCVVRGPFSGDSTRTLIAFEGKPADIEAETEDTAYFRVPNGVPNGSSHLIVAEGSRAAALPVDVAEITFAPAHHELREGQFQLVHATLFGPEDLSDEQWRAGVFPPGAIVDKARIGLSGFELPAAEKEGVIVFIIRNAASDSNSLRGSKNQNFVFKLTPDSFKHGEFKYQFVIEAAKSGSFALRGAVLPFLAPVHGQQFTVQPGAPAE